MRKIIRIVFLLTAGFLFSASGAFAQDGQADADYTPETPADLRSFTVDSQVVVDHSLWDRILAASVVSYNDVMESRGGARRNRPSTGSRIPGGHRKEGEDYSDLMAVPYDILHANIKLALNSYLIHLQNIPVTALSRDEQLAYWLNMYNAAVIRMLSRERSVKDIDDYYGDSRFDEKILTVEGVDLSLNDIAHTIVAKGFNSPLVIYGLVNAAAGAPNLRTEAFTRYNVWDNLRYSGIQFVNSGRGMKISGDEVSISEYYRMFPELFRNDAAILDHLRDMALGVKEDRLEGNIRIAEAHFDWNPNEIKRFSRSRDWSEILGPRMGKFGNLGASGQ